MAILMKLSTVVLVLAITIAILLQTQYRHNIYQFMVEKQFSRMKAHNADIGSFCIKYQNDKIKRFGDASSHLDCSATIKLYNDNIFFEKAFLYKDVGLGEAYVDGIWTVASKSDDLADTLVHMSFKLYNRDKTIAESIITFLNPGQWKLWYERQFNVKKTVEEDKYTISYHYDVGNDFYYNFLGDSMMYTCAFFANNLNKKGDLYAAQTNKIKIMTQKLDIKPSDNVLDIGSGWGFMASFMSNYTKAKVTGIALAKEQIKWSQDSYNKGNKEESPKYFYADYREYCTDIQNQKKYNKIYSIGMLEHVHSSRIEEFMQCMHELLMDENEEPMLMGLHHITRTNIYPSAYGLPMHKPTERGCERQTWVGKYMLPGGCLLHSDWVTQAGMKAGFVLLHKESYGLHYARTTRMWRQNIESNWEKMVQNHPDYDVRLYRSYMYLFTIAEIGFRIGYMDLVQQIFVKPSKSKSGFVDGRFEDVLQSITTVNQRDSVANDE